MECRQVQLASLPTDTVRASDFEAVDAQVPDPGPGQVLVEVRRLGLNAGLAGRIGAEGTAYGPGIGVGDTPASDAVVEVLDSDVDGFAPGDLAVAKAAWRTVDAVDAGALRRIDPEVGLAEHLTVLGHVGFTAWTGLMHVGRVHAGETVYVSGAAGGVGSCVVQFARAAGARVIGSAGSDEKVALLTEQLGADAAINRHDGPAVDLLRGAAPDGIDLFYDNVGGEQLEAALDVLVTGGRAVICGVVGQPADAGPRNLRQLIHRELTLRGFTVTAHEDLRDQFEEQVGGWLREGRVQSVHTEFEGVDRIPEAFASLLAGTSRGRVVVSLPHER